jgi:hypothetical protein
MVWRFAGGMPAPGRFPPVGFQSFMPRGSSSKAALESRDKSPGGVASTFKSILTDRNPSFRA